MVMLSASSTKMMKCPPDRAKRKSSGRFESINCRHPWDSASPAAMATQRSTRSCSYAAACPGPKVSRVQRAISPRDASAWRVRRQGLGIARAPVPQRTHGAQLARRLLQQSLRIAPAAGQWRAAPAIPSTRLPPAPEDAVRCAGPRWHFDSGRKTLTDQSAPIAAPSEQRCE